LTNVWRPGPWRRRLMWGVTSARIKEFPNFLVSCRRGWPWRNKSCGQKNSFQQKLDLFSTLIFKKCRIASVNKSRVSGISGLILTFFVCFEPDIIFHKTRVTSPFRWILSCEHGTSRNRILNRIQNRNRIQFCAHSEHLQNWMGESFHLLWHQI
jgi:hypothetical protein